MRKLLLSAAILSACATLTYAQPAVQGGLNVSSYRYSFNGTQSDRSAILGFNAGLLYRARLDRSVVLEPSLLFTRKGARKTAGNPATVDYYQNKLDYIQFSLPLLYRGYVDRGADFTLGAGPYAGYLAGANLRTRLRNGDDYLDRYDVGTGNNSDFRPLDGGLRFAGGLRFSRVYFYMNYDLGLANISPRANESIMNRCFGVNLAFFL